MNIEPRLAYFSIWRAAFSILRGHAGQLLWATLLLAAPFFAINGAISANHMMTLGGAAMTGNEISLDEMRLLWGSTVIGDSIVFVMLAVTGLFMLAPVGSDSRPSVGQQARRTLPKLLSGFRFWLFTVAQIVFFAMINTPDGRFKLSGMALAAASVLILWRSHDRDVSRRATRHAKPGWKGWLVLALVVATFPLLYILFNGYLDRLLLMLIDLAGQQLMPLFPPESPALPFGIITLSKFLSQWFNLAPMMLLLSACLAMRASSSD
jgi:hypothetical protein